MLILSLTIGHQSCDNDDNFFANSLQFYNDLTPLLLKQQMKITDFCFARKTEKEELMNDIQKQIANRPTQLPPSVPKYQTGSSSGTGEFVWRCVRLMFVGG